MKKTLYSRLEEYSFWNESPKKRYVPIDIAERIANEHAKEKTQKFIKIFLFLALVTIFVLNAVFLKTVVKGYGEEVYKQGLEDGYKLKSMELKLLPDSTAKVPFIPQPLKSL